MLWSYKSNKNPKWGAHHYLFGFSRTRNWFKMWFLKFWILCSVVLYCALQASLKLASLYKKMYYVKYSRVHYHPKVVHEPVCSAPSLLIFWRPVKAFLFKQGLGATNRLPSLSHTLHTSPIHFPLFKIQYPSPLLTIDRALSSSWESYLGGKTKLSLLHSSWHKRKRDRKICCLFFGLLLEQARVLQPIRITWSVCAEKTVCRLNSSQTWLLFWAS